MANIENNYYDIVYERQMHKYSDSDSEEDNPWMETSSAIDRDIQGFPWANMSHNERDRNRKNRLKEYKNYQNLSWPRDQLDKECKHVDKMNTFYDFQFNTRLVQPTIVHFQLRNLLWATSKHDVYFMQNFSVMHWSPHLQRNKEVLNVGGPIHSAVKSLRSTAQPISRVHISTMVVRNNLMVTGGFNGELICKYLNCPEVAFCTKISQDENAITNTVDIFQSSSGSTRLMTGNNDVQIRVFDIESFALLNQFSFSWSVNNTSASPDGKLFAVLGDGTDCLVADSQSGKVVASLKGHLDYSFSSAWHPDGRILATGNQDTTCRLWDVRNLSESLAVLKGSMGAIRAIKFTSDGRFMAMAEPADFVHIYDTRGYEQEQEIDFFGEIAGISFSPDTEALFVGVADREYGSLMEFNRRRQNHYLDSI